MATTAGSADTLASLSVFADLPRAQLQAVAHAFDEAVFSDGQRVLRRGFSGSAFHIVTSGTARVEVDGDRITLLERGEFFGDISVLLDEPPTADVVAVGDLRCLVLPPGELRSLLEAHPSIGYRMLVTLAARMRDNLAWRA